MGRPVRTPSGPHPLQFTKCLPRKTLPITTPSGYIIALLSGRPDAPSWDTTMEQLTGIMSLTRDRMHFDDKEATHRRGFYASVNTGISYGGGAKVCSVAEPSRPSLTMVTGAWQTGARIAKENASGGGSETMPAVQSPVWVRQQ